MNTINISTRRQAFGFLTTFLGSSLLVGQAAAHGADEGVQVKPVFKKELETHPEEEVSMTLVSYAPGTASNITDPCSSMCWKEQSICRSPAVR